MLLLFYIVLLCVRFRSARANVEKTIFVAPQAASNPQDQSIANLLLTSLNPVHLSWRTHLNASFPTGDKPRGEDSWLLLQDLNPGQRYETRVCWIATQPTSFRLDTFELNHVFGNPALISSLSSYAWARHESLTDIEKNQLASQRPTPSQAQDKSSVLFLRVQAAADYFSLNKTLMEEVPPVFVDLILDPYLFNVFPESLLPTAGYIVIIAVLAWFLSSYIVRILLEVARSEQDGDKAKKVI